MKIVGFIEIGYEVLQRDEGGLTDILPRLNDWFRDMDPEMLSLLVVHLCGEKPC